MINIHINNSCPKCNSYRLERLHRRLWMKIFFKSMLFECHDCHGYFLKWSIYCLEIKKYKDNDQFTTRL